MSRPLPCSEAARFHHLRSAPPHTGHSDPCAARAPCPPAVRRALPRCTPAPATEACTLSGRGLRPRSGRLPQTEQPGLQGPSPACPPSGPAVGWQSPARPRHPRPVSPASPAVCPAVVLAGRGYRGPLGQRPVPPRSPGLHPRWAPSVPLGSPPLELRAGAENIRFSLCGAHLSAAESSGPRVPRAPPCTGTALAPAHPGHAQAGGGPSSSGSGSPGRARARGLSCQVMSMSCYVMSTGSGKTPGPRGGGPGRSPGKGRGPGCRPVGGVLGRHPGGARGVLLPPPMATSGRRPPLRSGEGGRVKCGIHTPVMPPRVRPHLQGSGCSGPGPRAVQAPHRRRPSWGPWASRGRPRLPPPVRVLSSPRPAPPRWVASSPPGSPPRAHHRPRVLTGVRVCARVCGAPAHGHGSLRKGPHLGIGQGSPGGMRSHWVGGCPAADVLTEGGS